MNTKTRFTRMGYDFEPVDFCLFINTNTINEYLKVVRISGHMS